LIELRGTVISRSVCIFTRCVPWFPSAHSYVFFCVSSLRCVRAFGHPSVFADPPPSLDPEFSRN